MVFVNTTTIVAMTKRAIASTAFADPFAMLIHVLRPPVVKATAISPYAIVNQALPAILTSNALAIVNSRNVPPIPIVHHNWPVLMPVARIHAPNRTFAHHNKLAAFWIHCHCERLCAVAQLIRLPMARDDAFRSDKINLDAVQTTSVPIQINVLAALVSWLVVSNSAA